MNGQRAALASRQELQHVSTLCLSLDYVQARHRLFLAINMFHLGDKLVPREHVNLPVVFADNMRVRSGVCGSDLLMADYRVQFLNKRRQRIAWFVGLESKRVVER